MRVLMLVGSFFPEITATAPFNTDLAAYLVDRGHEVKVVSHFANYPQWRKHPQYRGKLATTEEIRGAKVRRLVTYIPRVPTTLKRIAFDTSFGAAAVVGALSFRSFRPDVIFSVCSPLQAGVAAAILKRLWGVPFVFHLQDLLPNSATDLNMLRSAKAVEMAHRMADFVYKRAAVTSAIGHGFLDALRKRGVPENRLEYFPNWVDPSWVKPGDRDTSLRRSLGIGLQDLLILYVGNLGFKQGMITVVEAAHLLREDRHLRFVIVGEGSDLGRVKERSAELGAPVEFLGVQPPSLLPEMLASGDILLLHQKREVVDMVVPSKLLTYSSAARPVLFAGAERSEGANYVRASGGGIIVAPEEPVLFADGVRTLANNPLLREELGTRSRAFVAKNFARDIVLEQAEAMLNRVARGETVTY